MTISSNTTAAALPTPAAPARSRTVTSVRDAWGPLLELFDVAPLPPRAERAALSKTRRGTETRARG